MFGRKNQTRRRTLVVINTDTDMHMHMSCTLLESLHTAVSAHTGRARVEDATPRASDSIDRSLHATRFGLTHGSVTEHRVD